MSFLKRINTNSVSVLQVMKNNSLCQMHMVVSEEVSKSLLTVKVYLTFL